MIYVGHHTTFNLNDKYLGSGREIKKAVIEFGRENFRREILFIFDTLDDMVKRESEIVTDEFRKREDTYNLALGGGCFGMLGVKLSEETCEKMSKSHVGKKRIFTPEHCENLSKSKKGKPQKPEHIEAKRLACIGMKRKPHSEETKIKMRETKKANPYIITDARRKQLRDSGRDRIWISNMEFEKTKLVKSSELEKYLNDGWIKCRMKF